MAELNRETAIRRLKTVPAMLATTALVLLAFPVLAPLVIAYDLVRLKPKLPTLRVVGFITQYLINDSIEILLWPFYRFVPGLDERIMWWSIAILVKRADAWLGLKVSLEDAALDRLGPGPLIVISRHVSIFDSILPSLVCRSAGLSPRGVIMAELLADPGFDIVYGRLGSVFIPRDEPEVAIDRVRKMTQGAGAADAFVIFPEGQLYSPARRERSLAKLGESGPQRFARLRELHSTLPPRPGGVLALLESLPDADVVIVDHSGLEPFAKLADLARVVPNGPTVPVKIQRLARQDIPSGRLGQTQWLDELWLELDGTVNRIAGSQSVVA